MTEARQKLCQLAELYGIELSYYDIKGKEQVASDQALYAILPHLGARLSGPADLDQALLDRQRALAQRVLEPVVVAWEGLVSGLSLQVPAGRGEDRWSGVLTLDSGECLPFGGRIKEGALLGRIEVGGETYERREIRLPRLLPLGYHRLDVEVGGVGQRALIISAPTRAHGEANARRYGVFAPAYALWPKDGTGIGGFGALLRLVTELQKYGAQVVGTLPLMAAFLDHPFEPSPYAPVSRLYWNELFIDLDLLPELAHPEVQAIRRSPAFAAEAAALTALDVVDYRRQMALHRTVLEAAAQVAWRDGADAKGELSRYAEANPQARDYARFRAYTELHQSWHGWTEHAKSGRLGDDDVDALRYRYHLYVQLRASQQIGRIASLAKEQGGGLYLDLPLGVHPDGYDAWRERESFLGGCSAGAPPDDLFAGGQDWGFRPLHPERIRERGYEYVIACIRHQLSSAGALRIDHVMGLERIFCVPYGLGGAHGLYVHYRSEELYAILTLESHRHRAWVIGEDLGTVPDVVRAAMNRHNLLRMYVGQFSMRHDPNWAIDPPPAQAVASLNTHDTPTFTAFWEAHDVALRLQLGHLLPKDEAQERESRRWLKEHVINFLRQRQLLGEGSSTEQVYAAIVSFLASSEAQLVLLNLDDLLGEIRPQNVPGTTNEQPNWRHKAKVAEEALFQPGRLTQILEDVARRRGASR